MSAARQPRKQARSEGITPSSGFFQLRHEQALQAVSFCKWKAELALVMLIASLANDYRKDGRIDGWTGVVETQWLADRIHVTPEMVNAALRRLCAGDAESPEAAVHQITVKEGLKRKLITREEARKTRMFGSLLRLNLGAWEALAAASDAEYQALQQQAEEVETAAAETEPDGETVSVAAPVVFLPGRPAAAVAITPDIQRRLKACDELQPEFSASTPISFGLSIVGTKIKVSIAEPQVQRNQPGKHISPTHSKGDSYVLRAEDIGLRLARAGIAVDADLRLSCARELKDATAEQLGYFVARVVEAKRRVSRFKPGLILKIARDYASELDIERRVQAEKPPAPVVELPKTRDQLLAEYKAGKAARSRS